MQIPANRMAKPSQRIEPTPPVAVERVLVQPPPEYLVKCPHCGAARPNQWDVIGSMPGTGEHRKRCRACGVRVAIAQDYKKIRVIG
jgi:hypothetical protein